jgi:hypothetical protein
MWDDDRPDYCVWALDLRVGTPHLADDEDIGPMQSVSHDELLDAIGHPDVAVGHAYAVPAGWLITTHDAQRVRDPAILDPLMHALASTYPSDLDATVPVSSAPLEAEVVALGAPTRFRDLYRDWTEMGLLYVPVEIADEVVASRHAVKSSATFGEARTALSATRYAELCDLTLPRDATVAAGDPLEAPDDWPALRFSEMPEWLPTAVVDAFGRGYRSMLDSGTSFDGDDEEVIDLLLAHAGVRIHLEGPDLEELFAAD